VRLAAKTAEEARVLQRHFLLRLIVDERLELRSAPDGMTGYAYPGGPYLKPEEYVELTSIFRSGWAVLVPHRFDVRKVRVTPTGVERLRSYDAARPGFAAKARRHE
jgi:hypothetical protein